MINAEDIKKGTAIRMDGKLYFCIDFLHVKPGKGNTFMRTKLKDVVDGYVLDRRFKLFHIIISFLEASLIVITEICSIGEHNVVKQAYVHYLARLGKILCQSVVLTAWLYIA